MTVRNIRAHQTRGLLPPPVVRGRTGYYSQEHVARIELTREMQADGLNLEAIRRVLESVDGARRGDLRLHPRPARPLRRGGAGDRRAGRAGGTLEQGGRGRTRFRDAGTGRKARHHSLAAGGQGRGDQPAPDGRGGGACRSRHRPRGRARHGRKAAPQRRRHRPQLFTDLFLEQVWEPFDQAGRPEGDWPNVREALDRMRPLGADVLMAVFQIAMAEATDRAMSRTIRSVARARPKGGKSRSKKRSR